MVKILLLQGANLTFLGRREPAIYGSTTAAELDARLQGHAQDHGYQLEIFYFLLKRAHTFKFTIYFVYQAIISLPPFSVCD